MYSVENSMYEIGVLLEGHFEDEQVASIGHHVYEISVLLSEKRAV